MKRLFLILIAVLFCIGMSVPAMAAEPKEYVFYGMPSISTFGDYDFLPDPEEGTLAIYEGALPSGRYDLYVFVGDTCIMYSTSHLDVSYSVEIEGFICSVSSFSANSFSDESLSYTCYVMDLYDAEGITALGLIDNSNPGDGGIFLPESFTIKLVSVEETTLPSAEIADIIHADLFGSFLICGTLVGLALFRGNKYA